MQGDRHLFAGYRAPIRGEGAFARLSAPRFGHVRLCFSMPEPFGVPEAGPPLPQTGTFGTGPGA